MARAQQLGSFLQPYFLITIDAPAPPELSPARYSLRELVQAFDAHGHFPTFLHEFSHYLQCTSTASGFSQLAGLQLLAVISLDCHGLVRRMREAGWTGAAEPPLIDWLRDRFPPDASAEHRDTRDLLLARYDHVIARHTYHAGMALGAAPARGSLEIAELELDLPPAAGIVPAASKVTAPRLVFEHGEGQGSAFALGATHVREGMSRAIELCAAHGFDRDAALLALARQAVAFFQAPRSAAEFDDHLPYCALFYVFLTDLRGARQHVTLDAFVALCELALVYQGHEESAARTFILMLQALAARPDAVPVLDPAAPRAFCDAIAQLALAHPLEQRLALSRDGMRDLWLAEDPRTAPVASLIPQFKATIGAAYEYRMSRLDTPLLFLDLLAPASMAALVTRFLDNLFIAFEDRSFQLFSDPEVIGHHLSRISLVHFLLESLTQPRTRCFYQEHADWHMCGYLEEGAICDSRWPRPAPAPPHPCPHMGFLDQLDAPLVSLRSSSTTPRAGK
jgi:hypothetical protein